MLLLKFARLHRKLTQARFGRMAGLSQNEISDIELGRLTPTPRQLARIIRALGLDPVHTSDLLTEVPDPLRPSVEPDESQVQVAEPESVQ